MSRFISGCTTLGMFALALSATANGDEQFTRVTSFDVPPALALQLHGGGPDPTLSLDIVRGGVDGAPPATDGERLLRMSFTNETDGKVEFGFQWSDPARNYDLAGGDALLLDVFIANADALPGLMGVFSIEWNPPSAWQPAAASPAVVGQWTTVRIPLSGRMQTDVTYLGAIVFENMPGSSGTIYVDHLRIVRTAATPAPAGVATLALADRNEVTWDAVHVEGLLGYRVYGADDEAGPFTQLTTQPLTERHFVDSGPHAGTRYYQVTTVTASGESGASSPAAAVYDGLTDADLLDHIQHRTFDYFWLGAHPLSGLIPEPWNPNKVAIGGSGMGLMAIVVGAERGWATREEAALRVASMLDFLEFTVERFHGAWPHVADGVTGEAYTIGPMDDGGDLVETSYVAQGLLTVRQYFDGPGPVEVAIRERATRMYEAIEWDWYRRYPESLVLWWHWSPNFGWAVDLPIRGYHEAMIVYLLAIASPTHAMPPESFYQGWASRAEYANGETYYGYVQDLSEPLGGPLFFTHYSALGFDPRFKRDAYTNYFVNGRRISLIHRAYAIDNPLGFVGYNRWLWGQTASLGPFGYEAFSPTNDNGTIATTAALSAMPYTPEESLQTLRYLYDTYGAQLDSAYGFYDALSPTENWFADQYISIDQGPIIVMIENYRTGLCWRLFMQNPEIRPMLAAIGFAYEPDLNHDGVIDAADTFLSFALLGGPDEAPLGDPEAGVACDRDEDGDFDLIDFAALQRF